MTIADYRVARRTEPEFAGFWGLWSDSRQRWIDIVYPTEREAGDMLRQLMPRQKRRS